MPGNNRTCAACGGAVPHGVSTDVALCDRCADTDFDETSHQAADVVPLPSSDGAFTDVLEDLLNFDENEEEEFLRQWDELEQDAVRLLRESLPQVRAASPPYETLRAAAVEVRSRVAAGDWPYRHVAAAAGWAGKTPEDDDELWLGAAGGLISMRDESGLDHDQESTLMAVEHADWLGAVIGLVRAGVGAPAEPHDLVRYVNHCPEVDGAIEDDEADLAETAFDLVVYVWEAVGALDEHHRLTALGWWGLPRALAWAWHGDFETDTSQDG